MLSYRLGGTDGVSIEAAKWCATLETLGFAVRLHPFWARSTPSPVVRRAQDVEVGPFVAEAVEGADVVVVENVLSLPLDRGLAEQVAATLRGRPTIVRHHDLPWQRPQWPDDEVPDDRAWAHVVLNSRSATELRARQGVEAHVLANRFPLDGWDVPVPPGRRGRVLLHPVRAIGRKDVPAAVRLAERLSATYWLTGPAEDGYDDELASVLASARCPVRHEAAPHVADAYAASDAVAFPSTLEGFGNPVIESALARRPLAVRRYPVLVDDLEPYGFRWFDHDDADGLGRFLDDPDPSLLDHNDALARTWFGLDRLPAELTSVLERVL